MEKKKLNTKLKVLMLHGYFQSDSIFLAKTGSFRKIFGKDQIAFEYLLAPHLIDRDTEPRLKQQNFQTESEGDDTPVYKWWDTGDQQWETAQDYVGASESIEFVKDYFRKNLYFDGIFGFSQGGVFTSILCTMRNPRSEEIIKAIHRNELSQELKESMEQDPLVFRFAAISSAFRPSATAYKDLYTKDGKPTVTCPVLFTYGLKDPLVVNPRTKALIELFDPEISQVIEHSGGHYVPVDSKSKAIWREFVAQNQLK